MIKVKYLDPGACFYRASANSVGYDICSVETAKVYPGKSHLFGTGVAMELPETIECQIRPRSGLATKHNLIIPNSPGTVDPDYRGEIKVCLFNLGSEEVEITRGQRIAQLVFSNFLQPTFKLVQHLSPTERAAGGFGSTGDSDHFQIVCRIINDNQT